jgi:hypothetical protein
VTNELNSDSIELMDTVQASFNCSDLENPIFNKIIDIGKTELCLLGV